MKPKLLNEEELKQIRIWASVDEPQARDVYALLDHIEALHQLYSCAHNWEYRFEVGFVCIKCKLERDKR